MAEQKGPYVIWAPSEHGWWDGQAYTPDVLAMRTYSTVRDAQAEAFHLVNEIEPVEKAFCRAWELATQAVEQAEARLAAIDAAWPVKPERPRTLKERGSAPGEGRQITLWAQMVRRCHHNWKPIQLALETEVLQVEGTAIRPVVRQPDLVSGRLWVVCMKCLAWSYYEVGWAGYYVSSPDLLEEEEANRLDREQKQKG